MDRAAFYKVSRDILMDASYWTDRFGTTFNDEEQVVAELLSYFSGETTDKTPIKGNGIIRAMFRDVSEWHGFMKVPVTHNADDIARQLITALAEEGKLAQLDFEVRLLLRAAMVSGVTTAEDKAVLSLLTAAEKKLGAPSPLKDTITDKAELELLANDIVLKGEYSSSLPLVNHLMSHMFNEAKVVYYLAQEFIHNPENGNNLIKAIFPAKLQAIDEQHNADEIAEMFIDLLPGEYLVQVSPEALMLLRNAVNAGYVTDDEFSTVKTIDKCLNSRIELKKPQNRALNNRAKDDGPVLDVEILSDWE